MGFFPVFEAPRLPLGLRLDLCSTSFDDNWS